MKIQSRALIATRLDWAVSTIEGYKPCYTNGRLRPVFRTGMDVEPTWPSYSTDGAQAILIIDREKIDLLHFREYGVDGRTIHLCRATINPEFKFQNYVSRMTSYTAEGPNALVAAMRCFVLSKLGEEVDVPEVLL